jgi:conjugal transfer pilus assembly protein TraF
MRRTALLLVPLLLASSTALGGGFFNSQKETGWFWHKDETQKKEKKKTKKPKVKLLRAEVSKKEKKLINQDAELLLSLPDKITDKDLDKLTPAQVGRLWELYYERALWKPNEQDYENLLKIQDYAIKKSEMHTVALLEVLRKHPEWNPNVKRPIVTYGRRVHYRIRENEINDYLRKYKDKAGLYFFFESNCPFCTAQASVLKLFQKLTGWQVLPISVDGICLPQYPGCQPDRGLAEKLNIKNFPAIFLVIPHYKDGKPFMQPVSYGLVSMDELKKTIYLILYEAENGHPPDVEKKEWQEIRKKPPKNVQVTFPKDLQKVAKVLNSVRETEDAQKEVNESLNKYLWGEQ